MQQVTAFSRAQTVPAVPSAAPKKTLWILNSWRDLILYVGTPLFLVPMFLLAQVRWRAQDIYLFVAAFGAMGHHLPGMIRAYGDRALFDVTALELDVDRRLVRRERQHLLEAGNENAWRELDAGDVFPSHRRERLLCPTAWRGNVGVVVDDWNTVGGLVDIQLDRVGAELDRPGERGESDFRKFAGRAAVSDALHAAFGARHSHYIHRRARQAEALSRGRQRP